MTHPQWAKRLDLMCLILNKLRMKKNLMNSNSRLRSNISTSTTSSPNNYMSPQGRLGRFIENIKNRGDGLNSTISSQIIHTLTPYSKNKDFKSHFLKLEEDIADSEFRRDFNQLLDTKEYTNQDQLKLRENLIWKIKKVIWYCKIIFTFSLFYLNQLPYFFKIYYYNIGMWRISAKWWYFLQNCIPLWLSRKS